MCVVEAGPGALKPACATYLQEGMEIKTTSPEIEEIRKTILQLLFAERNHYCMYCEMSGNCELQDLGYRYGLDHFEFPPYEEKFPLDTTHPYILFDQNRCVLCRRCARACAELAGHYVLEVKGRGTRHSSPATSIIPSAIPPALPAGSVSRSVLQVPSLTSAPLTSVRRRKRRSPRPTVIVVP